MDYEKAYKEALERAKAYHRNELAGSRKEMMEYIFPQLCESEDERMRRKTINCLTMHNKGCVDAKDIDECIAWLEKQKQQKQTDLPAGFYVTLPDGKKYYTKEMRCNGMNVKVVVPKPAEWSEEDEEMWMDIKRHMIYGSFIPFDKIEWIENRLKSLCPSWKPSKEQMEALMLAIEGKCPPTSYMSRRLEDLYEGLANTFGIDAKLD